MYILFAVWGRVWKSRLRECVLHFMLLVSRFNLKESVQIKRMVWVGRTKWPTQLLILGGFDSYYVLVCFPYAEALIAFRKHLLKIYLGGRGSYGKDILKHGYINTYIRFNYLFGVGLWYFFNSPYITFGFDKKR